MSSCPLFHPSEYQNVPQAHSPKYPGFGQEFLPRNFLSPLLPSPAEYWIQIVFAGETWELESPVCIIAQQSGYGAPVFESFWCQGNLRSGFPVETLQSRQKQTKFFGMESVALQCFSSWSLTRKIREETFVYKVFSQNKWQKYFYRTLKKWY